jgi:molybdenum cofactor cytidylyltransferase
MSKNGLKTNFGVILLGAGFSRRMGKSKLLLPWGKRSVIGHLISVWRELQAGQIAMVCSPQDPLLQSELDRLQFPDRILNPAPDRGMFSSVQCAARWTGWAPGLTHWIVALGDQPHLRIETLETLLKFALEHPEHICQPSFSGRPRHPVILPQPVFHALKETRETNLKDFLRLFPSERAFCDQADPGLDCDLDTPADYEYALRLFAPATPH